jgi:hypothetical protein
MNYFYIPFAYSLQIFFIAIYLKIKSGGLQGRKGGKKPGTPRENLQIGRTQLLQHDLRILSVPTFLTKELDRKEPKIQVGILCFPFNANVRPMSASGPEGVQRL